MLSCLVGHFMSIVEYHIVNNIHNFFNFKNLYFYTSTSTAINK